MAEIVWEILSVDSVNYTVPEATYTGETVAFGNTFKDTQVVDLNPHILEALGKPEAQNDPYIKKVVSQLCGTSDFTWSNGVVNFVKIPEEDLKYYSDYEYRCQNYGFGYTPETAAVGYMDWLSRTSNPDSSYYNMTNISAEQVGDWYHSWGIYCIYKCLFTNKHGNRDSLDNLVERSLNPLKDPNYVPESGDVTFTEILSKIVLDANSDSSDKDDARGFIDTVAGNIDVDFNDDIIPKVPVDYICTTSVESIDYHELARSRYAHPVDSAEFDALVQTCVEHRMVRQCQYLEMKSKILDIDVSEGSALDAIGNFVGQPRTLINFITKPYFGFKGARNAQAFNVGMWYTMNAATQGAIKILSDEEYRNVIKARIIKNKTRNTRKDLVEVLMLLGGNKVTPKITYLRHGSVRVSLNNLSDPEGIAGYFLSRYMDDDTIIPRPLGYRFTFEFVDVI